MIQILNYFWLILRNSNNFHLLFFLLYQNNYAFCHLMIFLFHANYLDYIGKELFLQII